MIPYRKEGTLSCNLINRFGFKLGLWYNESSKLAIMFAFPIFFPYIREAEDFDTLDLVKEWVVPIFYFRFRIRADHIGGKRWLTGWGTSIARIFLVKVIATSLERGV